MTQVMNVLRQHLPVLNEISDDARSRIKYCIVANRDDNLSIMSSYPKIYAPALLEEFGIDISEKLMKIMSFAVKNIIFDIDSLKTNHIRIYMRRAGAEELLEYLGVDLGDHEDEFDSRWGIGLLYDLAEDAVVEYKDYWGDPTVYGKQYKYDADLNLISEVEEAREGDFNDMTGLIDDLTEIGVDVFINNRTQVQRSYVSIKV